MKERVQRACGLPKRVTRNTPATTSTVPAMIQALRLDSVRGRLTLFWVAVLATALVTVGGLIYVLLARALYTRIDENLRAVLQIARTSLANDLGEGQDYVDAARSTAAELSLSISIMRWRSRSAVHSSGGNSLANSSASSRTKMSRT